MDAIVAQILGGFRSAIGTYGGKLDPENAAFRQARDFLAQLEQLADRAGDMASFTTGAGDLLGRLGTAIAALASEKPSARAASSSGAGPDPAVAQAAAGYHMAYDSIRGQPHLVETRKVYERVFAIENAAQSPVAFQRQLAEEGLLCAMTRVPAIENTKNQIELTRRLSLPVMTHYHDEIVARLEPAKSPLEVEFESTRLAEIAEAESVWDTMLTTHAFSVVAAITAWIWVKDEPHRQAVEDSYRFVADTFGLDWDAFFGIPRFWDHFQKVLFQMSEADLRRMGMASPEAFRDDLRKCLDECMRCRPPVVVGPPANRTLVLWGAPAPLDRLLDVIADAPRPAPARESK